VIDTMMGTPRHTRIICRAGLNSQGQEAGTLFRLECVVFLLTPAVEKESRRPIQYGLRG
jgi:hypothetical protein